MIRLNLISRKIVCKILSYQNLKQCRKVFSFQLKYLQLGQELIQYLMILWISFSLSLCSIYRSVLKTTELRWHWSSQDTKNKVRYFNFIKDSWKGEDSRLFLTIAFPAGTPKNQKPEAQLLCLTDVCNLTRCRPLSPKTS